MVTFLAQNHAADHRNLRVLAVLLMLSIPKYSQVCVSILCRPFLIVSHFF
jgi:hypothetical protein